MKRSWGLFAILMVFSFQTVAQTNPMIYSSNAYSIYHDGVVQQGYQAKALSPYSLVSDYQSTDKTKKTDSERKIIKDLKELPIYKSDFLISDALYNLALEEMINAVEPDSTFRTGKEWAGVWTRDISYSIILSMAYMQPQVAKNSLMRKVKNGRIIQDTGTGGAYPVSTDRMIWATAAWELYKATGDKDWMLEAYQIIKNSIGDDRVNAYDAVTGLVRGESSFLDWREETYPRWMQPADIYESENLGTNAVHYQANSVLAQMAKLLNKQQEAQKYEQYALKIKDGINQYLWMPDKGYYGQYLYGRNYKMLSPRAEALGEALCVIFGIASPQQRQSIVEKVPVMDYGISCIYPQIPNIPPYHNNAVWPFVQTYWALASMKAANETSVLESMAAVYRPGALFLTNKENFVASTGDFAGTEINSSNMLWSLSGNLALVHKILFGIEFGADKLVFHPFVPKVLAGTRTLSNFKYRKTSLDIELLGYGNKIKLFELDGQPLQQAEVPYTLTGKHSVKITLSNEDFPASTINKVPNYTTIETPVCRYENGALNWEAIPSAKSYTVIKNGKVSLQTTENSIKNIAQGLFAEYQVMANDAEGISSFASEPVIVVNTRYKKQYEMENYAPAHNEQYKGFIGKGYIEVSKTVNREISILVSISKEGFYLINFRYSNGNGPINTENKCAVRTLSVNNIVVGAIILPQRGVNDWSWGYSNSLQVRLKSGLNTIKIVFSAENENMNGDINQAMLDQMQVIRMK